jgi:hypothetical protein
MSITMRHAKPKKNIYEWGGGLNFLIPLPAKCGVRDVAPI